MNSLKTGRAAVASQDAGRRYNHSKAIPAAAKSRSDSARISRADQREMSKQRLIWAARDLCAGGKFLSCSVAEIADKAELSRGGFYLHFKSKQDLLNAVMGDQLDWYVKQHNMVTEARVSTKKGIISWFWQFVEGFREAGDLLPQFWLINSTRESVRQQHINRVKGVEALGHRIPALRIFKADGSIDADRHRRVMLFVYQLEQACTSIAFEADDDADATLEVLADDFTRLMAE